MEYLEVKNWRKVQTYRKDRGTPDWIKVKRSLLTSAKWAMLSDAQKGHLVSIWLIAAEREGKVANSPEIIRKVGGLDDAPDLDLFISIGFLEKCHNDDQLEVSRLSSGNQVVTREKKRKEKNRKEERKEVRAWPKTGDTFFEYCSTTNCLDEALDWLGVLKRKKASMSELAFSRRLAKLQRLADNSSESEAEIIMRSSESGWSDLYERNERKVKHEQRETAVQRRQREAREALGN